MGVGEWTIVALAVGGKSRIDAAADGVGGKAGIGISMENPVSQTQVAMNDAPIASRRDDAVHPVEFRGGHLHCSPVSVLNVGAWDT